MMLTRLFEVVRAGRCGLAMVFTTAVLAAPSALAQETVCARVKIEIRQELTLERQAFDAQMKINNTTDSGIIENVSVEVKVTDENGTPVPITSDPNDLSAKFFVRLSSKENIGDVAGSGTVSPKTTATINWLLIPAPGSAGTSPLGKKYLVGATLRYRYGGENTVLDVSPDVITVKPLPLLTLDYFLPRDVEGDDPLTDEIEPIVPFTLGVRVRNTGAATAKNLKIDSAQPKIIENKQGLAINFQLTGSYVNDAPAQNSLLIDFGDIAAATAKTGRWIMETSLAGRFTEFTARFTHADELGGALTSLLQATNTHTLIRDVRVDLPGRDYVRDFLAQDGDVIRVYESDSTDTEVRDFSSQAQLQAVAGGELASYRLTLPPSVGFIYVRLPDPFQGQKALGRLVRSDAKVLSAENVWLSRSRNPDTKQWQYWFNLFDANSGGQYQAQFEAPPAAERAPVLQFVPDRTVKEGQQVSFLVEGSSPDGKAVQLSAAPLPAGASFTAQAGEGGLARSVFDWTPTVGQAGNYRVVYTASDGRLSATRSAVITVEADEPPPGPATPQLVAPLAGAQVGSLKPTLSVQTGSHERDPTTRVEFEVYADAAMTQQVATGAAAKAAEGPTGFVLPEPLNDNTRYWWRARAHDGSELYSAWIDGEFFVNQFNDAPEGFNLTSPAPNAEVAELQPTLSWTHAIDKDGDAITYAIALYRDAALSQEVAKAENLQPGEGGSSSWLVPVALANHGRYYWRVTARDALGAQTASPARPFVVNTGNVAPTAPVLLSPAPGSQVAQSGVVLTVGNSSDVDGDLITYVFELDTVNTFDSGNKRSSGQVIQSAGEQTGWAVAELLENQRYHWRVQAQDGRAESAWAVGEFLVNAVNDAPPAPSIRNPGDGAWSGSTHPSLEAHPVVDPEGEAVRYEFQVFADAALSVLEAEGSADSPAWIVTTALKDKARHWWRVRAVDAQGAAGPWSAAAVLYVSTVPYQDPTIQVTAPAQPQQPVEAGNRKEVTIHWQGINPSLEATVALYYGTAHSGYEGTLIVDGLRQAAGQVSADYRWDVTSLAPGTYYVYAVIYDTRGVGRAYAPGAVVIVPATQSGRLQLTLPRYLITYEGPGSGGGGTGGVAVKVRLANPPTQEVTVPLVSSNSREGYAQPERLVFTPQNWSVDQTVTILGRNDCVPDGNQAYSVTAGKVLSLDGQYMGVSAAPIALTNRDDADWAGNSNDPKVNLCGLGVVSERQVGSQWEAVLSVELTNLGSDAAAVRAQLTRLPAGMTVIDGTAQFGAVRSQESARAADTVTVRSPTSVRSRLSELHRETRWAVDVTRQ
ncbi:Ig domain-containing protein [Chitiniphilus purpureus]|uniref:Ig domain-containing protein n=1 Tax=Chitiniphilus purpureus TaxID=2981137 RepID=A0ABY6DLJ3_9NEIS|nr:Ig domain-containing protein [Chitiniphilus sp. CD1]UXY15225.1 Ig domain-containing protein [Chitiniphilus sp. CD1]